jgi:hypothetical protein
MAFAVGGRRGPVWGPCALAPERTFWAATAMTSSGHAGARSVGDRQLMQLSNLTIAPGPSFSAISSEILHSDPGSRRQNPDRTSVRHKCLRG